MLALCQSFSSFSDTEQTTFLYAIFILLIFVTYLRSPSLFISYAVPPPSVFSRRWFNPGDRDNQYLRRLSELLPPLSKHIWPSVMFFNSLICNVDSTLWILIQFHSHAQNNNHYFVCRQSNFLFESGMFYN